LLVGERLNFQAIRGDDSEKSVVRPQGDHQQGTQAPDLSQLLNFLRCGAAVVVIGGRVGEVNNLLA
jgi:hypothetical protein